LQAGKGGGRGEGFGSGRQHDDQQWPPHGLFPGSRKVKPEPVCRRFFAIFATWKQNCVLTNVTLPFLTFSYVKLTFVFPKGEKNVSTQPLLVVSFEAFVVRLSLREGSRTFVFC
jgi:hypothetical protein